MITSLQNERVRLAHALQTQAKARRKEDKIVLEGLRLVRDALQRGFTPDFILYDPAQTEGEPVASADPGALASALMPDGAGRAFPLLAVSSEVMRHVSDTVTPPGVIAIMATPAPPLPQPLARVLILDAVRDPGNIGTILRTAAAAGVDAVLLSPGCADAFSPKALRAGMGAQCRIPALEASWTRIALLCQALTVYLADMTGDVAHDAAAWQLPHALIIGSEAHGASAEAETLAAHRVFIPMAGDTESLNAAVAAGILLFAGAPGPRSTGGAAS